MKKLLFKVEGYVEMLVDDDILVRATEIENDGSFGAGATQKDVLENLAFNFTENNAELRYLDGFADIEDSHAKLVNSELEYDLKEVTEQ